MGQTEDNLPGSPRVVNDRDALPIIQGCEDGCRGHHHKFDINNGHANLLHLLLSILHHDNELGDTTPLEVLVPGHVQVEGDHVNGMQPSSVGIKVGHGFKGRDLHIESISVLQVVVPNLVNNVEEEFGNATFGCFVAGVVVELGFVDGLGANTDGGHGLVGDVPVVEGEAGRPDKLGGAMVGFVFGGLHEDGCEGMDP
jgi:hypothetical protein